MRALLVAFALTSLATAVAQDNENRENQPALEPQVPAPVAPPILPVAPSLPPRTTAAPTATQAPAPVTRVNSNEVLLNFQAADIQAVVKAVSQMTGRNFLLDPRVKGQVTIISAKAVPRSAAYDIFLSALKAQGFTAVDGPSGLVRIIPLAEGRQGADVQENVPRGGERITTHVSILQNISPTQMVPLLPRTGSEITSSILPFKMEERIFPSGSSRSSAPPPVGASTRAQTGVG